MRHNALQVFRLFLVVFAVTTFTSILNAETDASVNTVSGSVANINHTSHTMGMTFRVQFSDINYDGRFKSVEVIDVASEQTTVRILLSDVKLIINRTTVRSSRRHASCGPIEMKLGTARDLVVEYEVKQDNEAELMLVDSKFKLDRDNLEIGSPRWVQTNGIGMTKSRVASGLRSGLSSNTPLLERLLAAELPNIYKQIEDEIEFEIYATQFVSHGKLATR